MAENQVHKPGSIAAESGFYEEVAANGSKTGKQVKVNEGKQFPPTRKHGQGYIKAKKL